MEPTRNRTFIDKSGRNHRILRTYILFLTFSPSFVPLLISSQKLAYCSDLPINFAIKSFIRQNQMLNDKYKKKKRKIDKEM